MFYSTQVLSKSKGGALGRVWMLAHGQRLPKRAILTSSVVEIVPKILNGPTGSEVFALRVSGILMAGVVIVQNRKSRYLYADANDILMRVNSCYATPASVNLRTDHMRNDAVTVGPYGAALDVDFLLLGHRALSSPALTLPIRAPLAGDDDEDDIMLVAMPATESMPLDDLMDSQMPRDVRWAARSTDITMPDAVHSMTSGLAQEDTMGFGGDGDVVDMLANWTNADGTFADGAGDGGMADFWAADDAAPGDAATPPPRKRARRQPRPQQLVIDSVTELAQDTYRAWLADCDDLLTTRPTHRYKGTRKEQYLAALDQVRRDHVPAHMAAVWDQWSADGLLGAQQGVRGSAAPRQVFLPDDAGFGDGDATFDQDLFGQGWSPVEMEVDDVEQLRARAGSSRASSMGGSRLLQWSTSSQSPGGLPQAEMDTSGRRLTLGANVSSIGDFGTADFDASSESQQAVRSKSRSESTVHLSEEDEFMATRRALQKADAWDAFGTETVETHRHLADALDAGGAEITFHDFVSAFDIGRSQVARIFNQILVLRSIAVIDTTQAQPYGDIHVRRGAIWDDFPQMAPV